MSFCWICPFENKEEFYDPKKLCDLLNKELRNEYTFAVMGGRHPQDDGVYLSVKKYQYDHMKLFSQKHLFYMQFNRAINADLI